MPFNPLQSLLGGIEGRQQFDQIQAQQNLAQAAGQEGFNSAFSPELQQVAALSNDPAAQFLKLDKRKQQSFFNDARKGLNFAKNGQFDKVMELAQKRLKNIGSGDTSDTMAVIDSIANRDFDKTIQLLQSGDDAGVQAGALTDPREADLKRREREARLRKLEQPEQFGQRKVQNSREVEGGTLLTFNDGSQEFKQFGDQQLQAELDARQRQAPKLTSALQNRQLKFQDDANSSFALADQTKALASKFQKINVPTGAAGKARESIFNFLGSQDEISNLRKDFTRIRNKLITKNLPQGPATDKDIELIAQGFPESTASKAQIVDFLGAMSRGQEAIAKFNEFQSVFLQENGNITKARRGFTFDGQEVRKGERLRTAYKRINSGISSNLDSQPSAIQQPTAGQFNSSKLGRSVSEQDISDTLSANPGMTREQLFQQLGIQ